MLFRECHFMCSDLGFKTPTLKSTTIMNILQSNKIEVTKYCAGFSS